VLFEGQALPLQRCDAPKPCPAFGKELVCGHEGIFRAQPVSHDPQAVDRGLIKI
jgi:hypothetical protein